MVKELPDFLLTFGRRDGGGPKARPESTQGPSGTLSSTPGDALGDPKAAHEPSKDTLEVL